MSSFLLNAHGFATSFRPPRGVATFALLDAAGDINVVTSVDRPTRLFEAGSLTKTMTATVLAQFVTTGTVTLNSTVGELLGTAAQRCDHTTLRELATHTSGLPPLPPGAMRPPFWPRDPYAFFGRRRLLAALGKVEPNPGGIDYSNFGYDVLALCLEAIGGAPLRTLLKEMLFDPLGMHTARCQPCSGHQLERGHGAWLTGGRRWHEPNPGGGGIDMSINDLAQWLHANLLPETTPIPEALRLTHAVHAKDASAVGLAWHHHGDTIWHNGATGSFRSMAAFRPGHAAMGALVSCALPGSTTDESILRLFSNEAEKGA